MLNLGANVPVQHANAYSGWRDELPVTVRMHYRDGSRPRDKELPSRRVAAWFIKLMRREPSLRGLEVVKRGPKLDEFFLGI